MKNRFNTIWVGLGLTFILFAMLSCAGDYRKKMLAELKPVEIERFLGTWYEIARYPHRFEKGLCHVTATYSLLPGNKIEVLNQGYKDGKLKKALGKAKLASTDGKGHLKVSFFWIFYADYFVLELDQENYSFAIIGSSSPDYFWILSRTPQLEPAVKEKLLKRAAELGYDQHRMEWVKQEGMP